MAGLFDGSPPPRDTILHRALAGLDPQDPPDVPSAACGTATDAVETHSPGDQFAQALAAPNDAEDDRSATLPYPPKPRPNLAHLDNVLIKPGSRVRPYVHPSMVDKVTGFIDELRQSGVPVMLTEAFRTSAMQAPHEGNKYGGAAPGRSLHEAGYAIDINWNQLTDDQKARALQIAPKHGLSWGGTFRTPDPVHFFADPFESLDLREAAIRAAQQEFAGKK